MAADRVICRCGPRDHVTSLRKELHWLPIEARLVFKILCYTYKAIHGNLPDYSVTSSVFTTPNDVASDRATLVSRDYAHCTVKTSSVKYGLMCYSLAAPAL